MADPVQTEAEAALGVKKLGTVTFPAQPPATAAGVPSTDPGTPAVVTGAPIVDEGLWEWFSGQDTGGQNAIINTADPSVVRGADTTILGLPRWAAIGAGLAVAACVVVLAATGATRKKQVRADMPDDDDGQ